MIMVLVWVYRAMDKLQAALLELITWRMMRMGSIDVHTVRYILKGGKL